ncbi:tRNA pseudouridine(38-40) synthase TruA [Nocardioides acrostichi]|uniref:tRNA pseudouridine synthase A n=1 Tax=Nocardioides acrostichi TaxID=2784339 RepID=A0A930YDZ2_9ACTN|nr:tRNA pseudouridine(38-40) synthase TruA [Nocardioides acrostichi]MBF4162954.1 tRNA pseudouridine(38-40) synthase TruA [Nocardioides acrostichi]
MRLRVDLAYDGTAFHGWATQPGLRTVQGEVERALAVALRRREPDGTLIRVPVVCAGRTDTGVHARGQVLHVDTTADELAASAGRSPEPPLDALTRRLAGILPDDVVVRRVNEAADGFDARFSATWRRYVYRVADRAAAVDPLARQHVLAWARPLDLASLRAASEPLVGLHDFAAFCKQREGATTVRTLLDLAWARRPDGVLEATVRADAFCHSMVRALVGCLLAVGEGRRPAAWSAQVLAGATRSPEVAVAPAHGLTLEEVGYPDAAELAARAEQTRARRAPLGEEHR